MKCFLSADIFESFKEGLFPTPMIGPVTIKVGAGSAMSSPT
jgi:hypothetical protein